MRPTSLLLLLALPVAALAGGGRNPFDEADESEFFELDEKLVTVSSRFAQSTRKAPNVVSVIDANQIRERGYRTVSDALRDLPGAYIWTSQEGRHLVALRGVVSADNNKVLLLVDGVPFYDGVYTHAWIDDYLPLHHIRQIELIKGPGSAVYGTNAFAGVINIVTFRGEDLKGGRIRGMVGGNNRVDVGVTAGDTAKFAGVDVGASVYARMLSQDGDGLDTTPRGRRDLRGEDPKRGIAVGTTAEIEGLTFSLHHLTYRHSFITAEQDDLFDLLANDLDGFGLFYSATVIDLKYDYSPIEQLRISPRLHSQRHDNPGLYGFWSAGTTDDDDIDTLDINVVETEKDTRIWGASVDAEARPHPNHVTVAGVGFDNTTVLQLEDVAYRNLTGDAQPSEFQTPPGERLQNGHAYVSHTWTVGPPVELTVGGRLDKRFAANDGDDPAADAFRLLVSPRFGLLLNPVDTINAKVLYGRAFRHGNVREILVRSEPDSEGFYPFSNGSLDLAPEQIDTVDLEIEARPVDMVTVRGGGSWSTVSREIDKVTPPNQYQNLEGTLAIASGEAEVIIDPGPVYARLAYTFTWAQYGSKGPYAGRTQYEVPPHMVKGSVTVRATDNWSATLVGEGYGTRPREDWTPNSRLPNGDPFGLLHATVYGKDLGPKGSFGLQATVRNVVNTEYETGVYRDEVDRLTGPVGDQTARYPLQHAGERRSVHVAVEVGF